MDLTFLKKLLTNKFYAGLIVVVLLTGCSTPRQISLRDLDEVPTNDCLNAHVYDNGITRQIELSKSNFESQTAYDERQKILKKKLWEIRFNCRRPI